jgi:macrolide-specific efflux system membrane fusion protein
MVIIPLVVVVAGGAVWLGVRSGSSGASNTTASTEQLFTVAPANLSETVSASGTIAAADTEDLTFAVGGTVSTVAVKAGQTVKKGEVLATVDSATLLSTVAQAQSTLDAAQATLSNDETAGASSAQIANDQAQLTTAYVGLVSATSDLSGATLTSPIAGTVATVNLTPGEVLSSSGASGTNLTGTGTGSGRTNTASSSNSSAASSASSASANTNSTAAASSTTPQIEVISSGFVVNLSVDTTTVGNLKVGQSATVTPTSSSNTSTNSGGGGFGGGPAGGFAGFGGARPGGNGTGSGANASTSTPTATAASAAGTVTSVGTIASSSQGVATFPVVVTVNGTPSGFHAGASASTVVTYRTLPNVLAVPTNAIARSNGGSSVTVSANGAKTSRVVTTGISSGGQTQITSGLSSGDQVVVVVPTRRTTGTGTNGNGGSFRPNGGGGAPVGATP